MNGFDLHFEQPMLLWLLAPAVLLFAWPLYRRCKNGRMDAAQWLSFALRLAAVAALVCIAAGAARTMPEAAPMEPDEAPAASRVLILADQPALARDALNGLTEERETDFLAPGQAGVLMERLSDYRLVVLVGVSAEALPEGFDAALSRYVRTGGSLLVTASDHSLAAGGMTGTLYETLLPVSLEYTRPDGESTALMLVIDCSNSMSGQKAYGGDSGTAAGTATVEILTMAKQGAIRSVESLHEQDYVGVVSFNTMARLEAPLTPATDQQKAVLARTISALTTGQGTYYSGALQLARNELARSNARVRHIIFLSDGEPNDTAYEQLVYAIAADGISLSTIAVGYDSPVLARIAEAGGGRYYTVLGIGDLPDIMLRETEKVAFEPLIEEETSVLLPGGLTVSLPPLMGYMGTTLKDGAQTLLETGRGDPLMARWQVEGGTVSVFTSDLTGSWTEAWRDNGQARSWLRQIFHPRGSDGPAQAADPAAPAVSAFWTKIDLLLAVSIAILALFLAELVIRRWQPRRARK